MNSNSCLTFFRSSEIKVKWNYRKYTDIDEGFEWPNPPLVFFCFHELSYGFNNNGGDDFSDHAVMMVTEYKKLVPFFKLIFEFSTKKPVRLRIRDEWGFYLNGRTLGRGQLLVRELMPKFVPL